VTVEATAAGVRSAALVVRALEREAVAPAGEVTAPARRRPDEDPGGARPRTPATTLCRCGHEAEAHEHFRSGSDCGACGAQECRRFRPQGRGRWPRLRRRG